IQGSPFFNSTNACWLQPSHGLLKLNVIFFNKIPLFYRQGHFSPCQSHTDNDWQVRGSFLSSVYQREEA
ncbi:hypothetical protein ACQP3D_29375, partial [Escherichia coli]